MSAEIIDITARRAAAAEAAAAAQKRDPFNNPVAVLIAQLVLHWMIQNNRRQR